MKKTKLEKVLQYVIPTIMILSVMFMYLKHQLNLF